MVRIPTTFRPTVSSLLVLSAAWLYAQSPAPASPAQAAAAGDRLPVHRVVLYKSGVGYFEHLGKVRGNQSVTIDFTSGQLDDVLKSLTTLDLDGGRVLGVSYNSDAALDRRLGALRLPVGNVTTRAQFLSALRGARLEVSSGASRVAGRLLSVERMDHRTSSTVSTVDTISLVSDAGEISTIALEPGVNVRILEADLNREVGRYLTLEASVRDQDLRRLTISTSGTGERDLFVSYVSEVPVWKATYRLVLPTADAPRKPLLQGWAIVDNTVGEDWQNVQLSLVAGAPQSFIQHISRPYYVQRPVVPLPERMLTSPQTHQTAIGTAGAGAVAGTVTDSSGAALPGVTVTLTGNGAAVMTTSTDQSGRYRMASVAPGSYDVSFTLPSFKRQVFRGVEVSGGMETVLNAKMELGGMTEEVTVSAATPTPTMDTRGGRGGGGGRDPAQVMNMSPGAVLPPAYANPSFQAAAQSDASGAQMGDLFEYTLKEPITIRKNQSALVPILSGEVDAQKVSLWNAASNGGRPLRAVWLTNSTGLTLDGGSFSITEGTAFAGEGLMDPLKAGERRLLSYATDLGLQVDAKGETVPSRTTKVQVSRGLLIQTTEERQRRTYTARNEDTEPRELVIEHPVRAGWTIGGTLAPAETTPAWYRFHVTVAPKTTNTFAVDETRPGQTQVSVASMTDSQVALLVRGQSITPQLEAALREVISRKAAIAGLAADIASHQNEIDGINRDQERVRGNMQALKGTAEEKQLVQRYVKQLNDQETRLDVLRKELQTLTADRDKAQAGLAAFIDGLSG